MKRKNTPAFPLAIPGNCVAEPQPGMPLRDYFAAKAMQATDLELYGERFGNEWAENVAKDSYDLADAMLKQRES